MIRLTDSRPQVLYVEDHPVNVLLMQALFERCPQLKLVVAETGHEALCLMADLHPVLLLLDLRLPDCHGSQLLPLLKLHAPDVPAVAVTAEDDFDITDTGFDEVWTKPLNLNHVFGRLAALTGPRAAAREHAMPEEVAALAVAHRSAALATLPRQHLPRPT